MSTDTETDVNGGQTGEDNQDGTETTTDEQYRQHDEESMDDSSEHSEPSTPDNGSRQRGPDRATGESLAGHMTKLDIPSTPVPT